MYTRTSQSCCGSQVVPDGVLVFLPSYGMMNQLIRRWQVRLLLDDDPAFALL